jgi:hypothetical protein
MMHSVLLVALALGTTTAGLLWSNNLGKGLKPIRIKGRRGR